MTVLTAILLVALIALCVVAIVVLLAQPPVDSERNEVARLNAIAEFEENRIAGLRSETLLNMYSVAAEARIRRRFEEQQ